MTGVQVIPAAELSALDLAAWTGICRSLKAYNACMAPEFTMAAAKHRPGVEVARITTDREPVGFFAFERHGNSGLPPAAPLSDGHGFVVRAGTDWSPRDVVAQAGLRVWHYDHLPAAESKLAGHNVWVENAPYMDLSAGYDSYRAERKAAGSSLISQTERKARKLEREVGPIRFELDNRQDHVLEQALRWKSAQLVSMGNEDVFSSEWAQGFLRTLQQMNSDGFAMWTSTLWAGDQLAAVHVSLESQGIVNSWIPAHGDSLAQYSPGVILHLELARAVAQRGGTRIDLGRGSNPMKLALRSADIKLGIGAVDLRPGGRTAALARLQLGRLKRRGGAYVTSVKQVSSQQLARRRGVLD